MTADGERDDDFAADRIKAQCLDESDFLLLHVRTITELPVPNTMVMRVLTNHYQSMQGAAESLRAARNPSSLLRVRQKLREYYEWSGRYWEGLTFGEQHVAVLEHSGNHWDALWARIKEVAYMHILVGEHQRARHGLYAVDYV